MLPTYLWLQNRLESEEGQDLVEYALLLVFIAIIVIAALQLLGPVVAQVYNDIRSNL